MPNFWMGVLQTAIGSGLGFGLGILAFHYQQHRQSIKKQKEDWRSALDALNRLSTAAGANIEALANTKLQLINDIRPEVENMKKAAEKAYDAKPQNRGQDLISLKELSESMQHFYMSLPKVSIMAPPQFSEYSSLHTEMPALTLYVHRSMGMMQELNELIQSRNNRISDYAREGGTEAGMTSERLLYYSNMLADEGMAICNYTDFALDFWRLVLDQVKAYMTKKAEGERYLEYTLIPKAAEAMPEEELFPKLREQLKEVVRFV